MTPEEAKKALDDYKPSDKTADYSQGHSHINQQVCPSCGYCPCCGRLRGNFNYPTYPSYPWPYYPTVPYYQGPTCVNT